MQDWASVNTEHIQRWTESAAVDVIVLAEQYNDGTYWEYLSWYHQRMRATLLSGLVEPAARPFSENRAYLLHVVVCHAVLITIFIS